MTGILDRLRRWARTVTRDVVALHLTARDPRVPWPAKAVAARVAAHALSPIDLIPDFVPVLGHLDDLVVVPLGILLAVKLVPPDLMAEFRGRRAGGARTRPTAPARRSSSRSGSSSPPSCSWCSGRASPGDPVRDAGEDAVVQVELLSHL
jgi:uncharacterized membrane protein YkvA (DUF1232 family)